MDITKINISQKNAIENIRKKFGNELSSHAFNSLYLWREQMKLSIYLKDDFFAVKSDIYGENAWFFPCGEKSEILKFINSFSDDKTFSMVYLRECDVEFMKNNFPQKWNFRRREESDEYICDISDYVSLNGSKFSEIRRNIRKIENNYKISVKEFSDETLYDVISVICEWRENKQPDKNCILSDDDVSENAVMAYKELGISGIIMYINGVPSSVFAGFPLTDDTVDVMIGKCIKESPRGTVYYALRQYLLHNQNDFAYCNHEEDLGIMGIRRIKESLCPIKKNKMWEAFKI